MPNRIGPFILTASALVCGLVCLSSLSSRSFGAGNRGLLTVLYNGKSIGTGVEENGKAYISVDALARYCGLPIRFNEKSHTIRIEGEETRHGITEVIGQSPTAIPFVDISNVPDPYDRTNKAPNEFVPGTALGTGSHGYVRNANGLDIINLYFQNAILTDGKFSAEINIAKNFYSSEGGPIRADFSVILYDANGQICDQGDASISNISSAGGSYILKLNPVSGQVRNVIIRYKTSWLSQL